MLIFMISDINQAVHPKLTLQICIFTVLDVQIREGGLAGTEFTAETIVFIGNESYSKPFKITTLHSQI